MIVTGIESLDKSRFKIYIDGEFAFVLYRGELNSYKVIENEEITEDNYEEIMHVLLPKRAIKRAMNLLQKKMYAENELRNKLREGFYPEESIDAAVQYVSKYHYVDDLRLATDYIRYHIKDKSQRQIEMALKNKGIDKTIVEKAFEDCERIGIETNPDEQIQNLLEKKHYDKAECDLKTKQKIIAFLLRRGFMMSDILKNMD